MKSKYLSRTLLVLLTLTLVNCASRGMHIGNHIIEWHEDYGTDEFAALYDPNTEQLVWSQDPTIQEYIVKRDKGIVSVERAVASSSSSSATVFRPEGQYEYSKIIAKPGYKKAIVIYSEHDNYIEDKTRSNYLDK